MGRRLSPINDMRLLLLVGFCATLASQAAAADDDFGLPAYVSKIEHRVRANGAAVKTTKELLTGTDGGGEMTIYSKAGQPVEVIVSIFLSSYEFTQTFLYYKGTLVLVIKRHRSFKWDPKTETLDPGKTGKLKEERSYFKNGDLVCWLTIHDTLSDEGDGPPKENRTPAAEKLGCLRDSAYFLNVATFKQKSVDIAAFIKG